MDASQYGIWLLEFFEGRRTRAYQDSKGIWTCGVGSTMGVTENTVWSEEEIEAALRKDLSVAENAVAAIGHVYGVPLTQPQFDALVSLTFNIGASAFVTSTVATELKKGRFHAAAEAFLMWNDHGLLMKRRQAEMGVFMYGSEP